jgi:hypothetical protein
MFCPLGLPVLIPGTLAESLAGRSGERRAVAERLRWCRLGRRGPSEAPLRK